MFDIVRHFDDQFEIVSAATPELKREAFRIRFSVFSEELCLPGNEPWHYPDKLETDAYDENSAHCLLRYNPTASWVGTVRLVLAPPLEIEAPFPVEAAAGSTLDTSYLHGVDRQQIAEISRFILLKPYRHGHDGTRSPRPKAAFPNHHNVPLPLVGLLAAMMQLTVDNGITHWLAALEAPLQRLLVRLGIELTPIGPQILYHGLRRPYFGEVSDVAMKLKSKDPLLCQLICDQSIRYRLPAD